MIPLGDTPGSADGSSTASDTAAMLAAKDSEIRSLREELDETNKGVVALYAELDQVVEQLRQASELKSRFLSYMSHEFRTPLGSIRSMSRLLLEHLDGPLSSEQETQVRFIQQSAMELSDLVGDLLDLAKVEAGKITVSAAWFEMVDLFAALRGMFKPLLLNDAVALVFEEPAEPVRIFTDDKKLSHILRNFISNALKFTERGQVTVRAAAIIPDCIRFSVSDTGIGIPQEYHGAVFEDFTQVDSPLQKRFRGTGLGLSLSKRFAELLGGKVFLESEPGQGSTFYVEIPSRLPEGVSVGDSA